MASYFERPWSKLSPCFDVGIQSSILGVVGFCLNAIGRTADAAQTLAASRDSEIQQRDWKFACMPASNLSELSMTLGDVSSAVRQGEQSVELADRGGDAFEQQADRTALSCALHASGRMKAEG